MFSTKQIVILFFGLIPLSETFATSKKCETLISELQSKEYYKENATQFDTFSDKNTADQKFFKEGVDIIYDTLGTNISILDSGTGSGKFLEYWNQNTLMTGIDISDELLNLARTKFPQSTLLNMDIRSLSFNNQSFDAVTLMYSLIHLDEEGIYATIKETHRVLRKDGYAFLAYQGGEELKFVDVKGINGLDLKIQTIPMSFIKKVALQNGFKVINQWAREATSQELPFEKQYVLLQKL